MGEEGLPQGVDTVREATGEKPSSCCRPVPPMTAMWTGPRVEVSAYLGYGPHAHFGEVEAMKRLTEGEHWLSTHRHSGLEATTCWWRSEGEVGYFPFVVVGSKHFTPPNGPPLLVPDPPCQI